MVGGRKRCFATKLKRCQIDFTIKKQKINAITHTSILQDKSVATHSPLARGYSSSAPRELKYDITNIINLR